VPCSVETQCYCFSQASQAEFYKPGRILQAQTSALAVGRSLEPSKIRIPNSRIPISAWRSTFLVVVDLPPPEEEKTIALKEKKVQHSNFTRGKGRGTSDFLGHSMPVFAFGRQQSCPPKANKALFDPTHPSRHH
jgi:hypothetical protein